MLNPIHRYYLIRSLQSLLMILPQESAYFALYNRLKCLHTQLLPRDRKAILANKKNEKVSETNEKAKKEIEECVATFENTAKILKRFHKI